MFDIHVGWSKEGEFAQLGVEVTPDSEDTVTVDGLEVNGLWATLSPENIDQLIKVLRKAKRQAFPK
jgi:hypothetical protein